MSGLCGQGFYLILLTGPWILLFDVAQADLELLYALTPASASYTSPLLFKTRTNLTKVLTKLLRLARAHGSHLSQDPLALAC